MSLNTARHSALSTATFRSTSRPHRPSHQGIAPSRPRPWHLSAGILTPAWKLVTSAIIDLEGEENICQQHLAEAIQHRGLDHYAEAGNIDRLFDDESELLNQEEFDQTLAGIRLLGRDMAAPNFF
jgi:hypothetical protein